MLPIDKDLDVLEKYDYKNGFICRKIHIVKWQTSLRPLIMQEKLIVRRLWFPGPREEQVHVICGWTSRAVPDSEPREQIPRRSIE